MQHFSVPTRLLDWTSSPFAGLFFAVEASKGDLDAAVWVLDPARWNSKMQQGFREAAPVFSVGDEHLASYCPISKQIDQLGLFPQHTLMRDEPLAFIGPANNSRMVAQRGSFAVFGNRIVGMEGYLEQDATQTAPLIKIVISAAAISSIRKVMMHFGFTHAMFFPDLEGLARDLKFETGF